jgi:RNA methyltransferase, TrmH family
VCDPKADFYNANVIRSSVGCVFTQPVAAASSQETIAWLRHHKIKIYATALTASVRYDTVDFTGPSALIMGTEATGLTQEWLAASDQNVIIPMRGVIDSMNVSAAAAVVVFEAARQRGFM